jgi:hypothetical protein
MVHGTEGKWRVKPDESSSLVRNSKFYWVFVGLFFIQNTASGEEPKKEI